MTETYCKLPFIHINQEVDGRFTPCCRFKTDSLEDLNASKYTMLEAHSHPKWNEIREKMKKGERVSGCQQCYEEEAKGIRSYRQRVNSSLAKLTDDKLSFVNISFSNSCNLKCQICSGKYSTSWIKEDTARFGESTFLPQSWKLAELIPNETLKDLKKIQILGGEPMMSPGVFDLISELTQSSTPSEIELTFTTNSTIFPKKEFLQSLTEFKFVEIELSIDATSDLFEALRYGEAWDTVESVAKQWLHWGQSRTSIEISIAPTIYAQSLLGIADLYRWIDENSFKHVTQHFLDQPDFQSYRNLPPPLAEQVLKKLEQVNPKNKNVQKSLEEVSSALSLSLSQSNFEHESFRRLINYLRSIEAIRPQSISVSKLLDS